MYVASYRNTVAGTQAIIAKRIREEQDKREREEKARLEAKARRDAEEALMKEQIAREKLARVVEGQKFRRTYREIERIILRATGVTRKELRSNRRNKHVVLARQAVAYWTCRLTKFSLPQIGKLMGGRDHTTVLHSKTAYVAKRATMGRNLPLVR